MDTPGENSLRKSLKVLRSPEPARTTDNERAQAAMQFSTISSSFPGKASVHFSFKK
jgi:hypothetical protein